MYSIHGTTLLLLGAFLSDFSAWQHTVLHSLQRFGVLGGAAVDFMSSVVYSESSAVASDVEQWKRLVAFCSSVISVTCVSWATAAGDLTGLLSTVD